MNIAGCLHGDWYLSSPVVVVANGAAINQIANQNRYTLQTAEPIGGHASLCRSIITKMSSMLFRNYQTFKH